jgi:hypothetical protein
MAVDRIADVLGADLLSGALLEDLLEIQWILVISV